MTLPKGLFIVAVVAFAASVVLIPTRAIYGAQVSGDEPHYLVTAISLGEDLDLDVSDEIGGGRYRPFHEIDLDPQSRVFEDGSLISPHDPLLPLLLALPMRFGGWVAAKFTLAVMAAALAGTMLWVAVHRFGAPIASSTLTIGLFVASAPLAVYGTQVYPELPAAGATIAAVAGLTGALDRRSRILVVASVVALPWLSIKYMPVAAALAVILLWKLWRGGAKRAAASALGVFAAAGGVFVVTHVAWYGGVTPYAAGDHFVAGEFSVVGSDPNFLGRARRLVGLLLDDTFGLVPWQPAYLLVVPALAALLRVRPAGWEVLVVPSAMGWVNATFIALTMHGWWFPGRQIVVVLPLLVIAVCLWTGRSRRRLSALAVLGTLGVLTLGWVASEGVAGRLTLVFDFYETSSPIFRGWSTALPDYLNVTAATWILQWLWVAFLGATAFIFGWRRGLGVNRV